ncbi:MAG: GNAT family N-acetyltransferase [Ruminococcus sp.]|uniref:GNAT family N-acetyltransferase n=1 Tax=Ruminococcus sp. TaxID=41978 RepID=UPI001B0EF596|nr:GNAT family N-acetyltransferase [Ruminococcus sp.]MBO7473403.1 GNAT family N-acetyltransferase [Ruminococcus sp.]
MIRRYVPDDLEGAAEVFRSAFAGEPWNENWDKELASTRIRELMSSPQSVGYVCDDGGIIRAVLCGRILTYLHGKEFLIDEFCVTPDMQHCGIGSEVLEYARKDLAHDNIVAMALLTGNGKPSQMFYIKNGFKEIDDMIFMYYFFEKKERINDQT